jgi:drug/metabolite transporter (DMT)-like permease
MASRIARQLRATDQRQALMTAESSSIAPERQNVAAGIGLILLAFFLFSANDAQAKWLAATYTPGQILLFRSILAIIVLAPFAVRAGLHSIIVVERPGLHLLRVLCAAVEVYLFYWAISALPLADAMTFYLASPIYVTALAALVLNESVGLHRWLAVVAGFIGVVVALQPSTAAFGWHALLAFAGSIVYAVFVIITRSVRHTPGVTLAFWQFAATLVVGAITAPVDWVPLKSANDAANLGFLGLVSLVAMLCLNRSLNLAPASVVVPYQNTLIIWGILFGYIFFGDVPGLHIVVGATIIIASCLYIFFRESRTRAEADFIVGP